MTSENNVGESLLDNKSLAKKVASTLGVIFTLLASLYFIVFFIRHLSSLPSLTWDLPAVASILAALFLYFLTFIAMVSVWFVLLRGSEERSRYTETITILALAQFGKYIPGNLAHHIGRLALAKTYGYKSSRVLVSMILEIGWAILAGTFLAFLLLAAEDQLDLNLGISSGTSDRLLLIIFLASLVIPLVISWMLTRWRPTFLHKVLGEEKAKIPGFPFLALAFLLAVMNFLLSGGMVYLLLRDLFHSSTGDIWSLSGMYAIAWVIGFITPGAPAGLGVRETIFLTSLRPIYGEGTALGLTAAMRVVTALGDAVIFVIGLLLRRWVRAEAQIELNDPE